jgi:lysozyme family protein
MSSVRFEACIPFVLHAEGGYVNDPRDPGGETKYGICKRAYPTLDIRSLTEAQAREIYFRDYWSMAHCEELPAGLDLMVLDSAVNTGIRQTVKLIQRAAGIDVDGVWGPATAAAARTLDMLTFAGARIDFYRALPKFPIYGAGWCKRVNQALAAAKAMQGSSHA